MSRCTNGLGVVLMLALSGVARADVVNDWNDLLLDGIRTTAGWAPPQIARAGAIVQTAVYDSVNSVYSRANPYRVYQSTPGADARVAATEAAYQTMSNLFGSGVGNNVFQSQLDNRRNTYLASVPNSTAKTLGQSLGASVASQTLGYRSGDGSNGSSAYTPGTNPGDWNPDYPGGVPGVGVGYQYRNVTPWTMNTPAQFRPAPCPPVGSPEYTAAYNEVKRLGARVSVADATGPARTADEQAAAWFWGNDRNTTFKPPGHYNLMARAVAATQPATMGAVGTDTRLFNDARMLALVNIAQADAGIAVWDCKYRPDAQAFWRPISGIRNGATDGNPDTAGDASWEPLSHGGMGGGPFTPGFPAYTSGHSGFGAATLSVLRNFFGTDNITFTFGTDDLDYFALAGQGATRTFTSLSQANLENAMSRIWLGVHWRFDVESGMAQGDDIGSWVFANALQVPTPGSAGVLVLAGGVVLRRRRR